jgi:3-oxoadipate enol-lactonase
VIYHVKARPAAKAASLAANWLKKACSDVQEDSMEASLAGGTVRAQILGDGPVLVLLHSLLADRSSFAGVSDALARNFRLVLPNLPGFPGSERVNGPLTAVADRMAEAVGDTSGGEPVLLLGNGYGGFLALILAIRHPELVSRLVLADAGAAFSQAGRGAFQNLADAAESHGLEAVADLAMRRLFAADFHAAHPELVADRRKRFLAMDREVLIVACRALAELDLRPQLARVEAPVLAIVGEQDEATPPAMSQELVAGLPNARLVVIPGCAHVPQLQAPEKFLQAVLPFLSAPADRAAVPIAGHASGKD